MPGTRYAKLQMTWFSLLACSGSRCGDRPKPTVTKWKVVYFLIKFQRHTQQFQPFSRFLSHLQGRLFFFFFFLLLCFLLFVMEIFKPTQTLNFPLSLFHPSPLPHPHNSFFLEFFKVNSGHKCQFTRKHIRMDPDT